jgi:predicted NUDIX family NTP pyrophosphohydrolase
VAERRSAGILLWRRTPAGIELLLAHPGGPYFRTRDDGAWTIPKGEIDPGEAPYAVARREFEEETGSPAPDDEALELGEIRQKGGKLVVAWALEGDLDPATATSNTFPLEWPPRSGRFVDTPEIDRVAWFEPAEARRRIKETQAPFIDRLVAAVSSPAPGP